MRIPIIIIAIILHLAGFAQQGVDFNHKKVAKFIKKTYDIETYNLQETYANHDQVFMGKYFLVNSQTDSQSIVYIGRVNSCRAEGCSIDNISPIKSYEYFDYIIAFDKDRKIKKIKIYNYQATHGQEITAKSWLKQFVYKEDVDHFAVNKNIDAISGATISVFAITNDVNMVRDYLILTLSEMN